METDSLSVYGSCLPAADGNRLDADLTTGLSGQLMTRVSISMFSFEEVQ